MKILPGIYAFIILALIQIQRSFVKISSTLLLIERHIKFNETKAIFFNLAYLSFLYINID